MKERDLYSDKVEISVIALIEIKRAFGYLIDNDNSYVHKVFNDDHVHHALNELKQVYAKYFDEDVKPWSGDDPVQKERQRQIEELKKQLDRLR